jgi:phage gpG-like protein
VVRLQLSVYGDEQIERELLRFSEYVGNPRPAFEQIRDDLEEQIAEQFDTEGSRGGDKWDELSESTLAQKAAEDLPPDILQASGRLLASFTANTHGDGIREITDNSFTFGSRVPYGAVHQKGSKDGTIPQRRILSLTELDRRTYIRTLQRYIIEGVL